MNKIVNLLLNTDKEIVLSTHMYPDGDALGSIHSLAIALKQFKKKVKILIDTNISSVPFKIKNSNINLIKKDSILFILDACQISRIPTQVTNLKFSNIIFMDHHKPKTKIKNALYFINTNASSTGEIIYLFIKYYLKIPFTKEIAKGIYTALITDTRSFKYSRTTALAHKIAYNFLKNKLINPELIQKQIYNTQNINYIKFKGYILSNFDLNKTNKIAYVTVSDKILKKFQIKELDLKSSYNDLFSTNNVTCIVLIYKTSENTTFYVKSDTVLDYNLYFKKHIVKISKYSCTFKLLNSIDENKIINKLDKLIKK